MHCTDFEAQELLGASMALSFQQWMDLMGLMDLAEVSAVASSRVHRWTRNRLCPSGMWERDCSDHILREAVFNRDSRVQGLQRFHTVHKSFWLKLNKHFYREGWDQEAPRHSSKVPVHWQGGTENSCLLDSSTASYVQRMARLCRSSLENWSQMLQMRVKSFDSCLSLATAQETRIIPFRTVGSQRNRT